MSTPPAGELVEATEYVVVSSGRVFGPGTREQCMAFAGVVDAVAGRQSCTVAPLEPMPLAPAAATAAAAPDAGRTEINNTSASTQVSWQAHQPRPAPVRCFGFGVPQ